MRIVITVLAGWTGATALALGVFLALVRGSGGTDAAAPPAPCTPQPLVLPPQRTGVEQTTSATAGR